MVFRTSPPRRPGAIAQLLGVIFQSDGSSRLGGWFIRPFETLDRRLAGADRPAPSDFPDLAMHAGLHVVMADGSEMVAEQLVGTLRNNFSDGLNWTPIEDFRERNHGGWDATVPATAFRGIDDAAVTRALAQLNTIEGGPFIGEDCTSFIERVFDRRLFADSPLLRRIGIGARIGDPALPLLRPNVSLDQRTADLVRSDVAGQLPDALAGPGSPNLRFWGQCAAIVIGIGIVVTTITRRRRKPWPLLQQAMNTIT
jgi:hypothetical protein